MSILDKASLIQIPSGYKNGKLYSVKPTPTYGSELVTNGDFATDSDWTKGTGWSISGGKANCDGSQTGNTLLYQNVGHSANKTYLLTFTISNYSSGQIDFALDSPFGGTTSGNGDYQVTLQPTSGGNFIIRANSTFIGSIDNVSVKEATNIGDFDFSRSSSATRVNSEGLIETAQIVSTTELVTNGDFASSSNWNGINANGVTISNGTLNYSETPNGINVTQSSVVEIGKRYKVTFTISNYVKGGILFVFGAGGTTQEVSSNGTFNLYGVASINTTLYIQARGASGTTLSIDNVSVKEVIENDVPRLDYSDGSCASLLLEPQRTNLITYSEDFSQWNRVQNTTLTTDSTVKNVDGTNSTKLTKNSTSTSIVSDDGISISASSNYVFSFFVKKGNYDTLKAEVGSGSNNVIVLYTFSTDSFSTSESGTQTITSVSSLSFANEWKRISIVFNGTITSINTTLFIGENTNDYVYYYGSQLEQGSYPTSYIPTSGSTVTRTADVCNNAGTSATFNDSEGVLFAEISALDSSNIFDFGLYGNTSTNQCRIGFFNNNVYASLYNGSYQTQMSAPNNLSDFTKIAFKFNENDFALWINGNEVATDSSGTTFNSGDLVKLNFSGQNGTSSLVTGNVKQLMVFNEALSDEELSDLTGQVNLSFNNLATFYGYTIL